MDKTKMRGDVRRRLTPGQIFTIPNLLSFLRILLVPFIVWFYVVEKNVFSALLLIILSTTTDILDGYIARKFNMVTDFGKMLDPVSDKLTQAAILICLMDRFPLMLSLVIIMAFKEGISLVLRWRLFSECDSVYSAAWHGKANTVWLYIVMCIHLVFVNIINPNLSVALIYSSAVFMLFSFTSYTIDCMEKMGRGQK